VTCTLPTPNPHPCSWVRVYTGLGMGCRGLKTHTGWFCGLTVIMSYYVELITISSHPFSSSSIVSSLSMIGCNVSALTSLSLTKPSVLHAPRQISARVDSTDSRLHKCDRRIQPFENVRSTSTEVATGFGMRASIREG
jgi:hypothetical protein